MNHRYPGARPFADDPLDRLLFFGRATEMRGLFNQIRAEDLLVLYGKSGMGKTSLLKAGLLEPLRRQDHLPMVVRVNDPRAGPFATLYSGIEEATRQHGIECTLGDRTSLSSFFRGVELRRGDTVLSPILILDQFEEIFTLQSPANRTLFIGQLAELVRPRRGRTHEEAARGARSRVKVVLSLREDFLGHLEDLASKIPQVFNSRFRVGALTRTGAAEAIVAPARLEDTRFDNAPFTYEPGTVDAILNFLSRHTGYVQSGKDEIEPFQLQLICQRIEARVEERQTAGEKSLVIRYDSLGGDAGMARMLEDFYETQISDMPSEYKRRTIYRLCEEGLINAQGRRSSLDETDIHKRFHVPPPALGALVERRLLRAEPRLGSFYYELSHDTLVAPILAARAKRLRQRRRPTTYGLILLGALLIVALGWWFEGEQISHQAAEVAKLATNSPTKALLHAIKLTAASSSHSHSGRVTPEVASALGLALQNAAILGPMRTSRNPTCSALSPRGDMVATGGQDGRIRLADLRGNVFEESPHVHSGPVSLIAFSPGADRVASVGTDSSVQLWDWATNRETLYRLPDGPTDANADRVAFDPDCKLLAVATKQGGLILLRLAGDQPPRSIKADTAPPAALAFSPDGTLVLWSGREGRIQAFPVSDVASRSDSTPQLLPRLDVRFPIQAWAVSKAGTRIVAGSHDRLWIHDNETAATRNLGLGGDFTLVAMAMDANGGLLAVAAKDGTVRILALPEGMPVGTFASRDKSIRSLAFDANGKRLACVSEKGVSIWEPRLSDESKSHREQLPSTTRARRGSARRREPALPAATSAELADEARAWQEGTPTEKSSLARDRISQALFTEAGELVLAGTDRLELWKGESGSKTKNLLDRRRKKPDLDTSKRRPFSLRNLLDTDTERENDFLALASGPERNTVITGDASGGVATWNLDHGLVSRNRRPLPVVALAMAAGRIVSVDARGEICVWRGKACTPAKSYAEGSPGAVGIASELDPFERHGITWLVTASRKEGGASRLIIGSPDGALFSFAFTAQGLAPPQPNVRLASLAPSAMLPRQDGETLIAGYPDGTWRRFAQEGNDYKLDVKSKSKGATASEVRSIATSADGGVILTTSADGTVTAWMANGDMVNDALRGGQAVSAALSADGSAAILNEDQSLMTWRRTGLTAVLVASRDSRFSPLPDDLLPIAGEQLAVSPSGDTFVTLNAVHDGTLVLWDLNSAAPLVSRSAVGSAQAPCEKPSALAAGHLGVAVGCKDGSLHLFDRLLSEIPQPHSGESLHSEISALAVDQKNRFVVAGDESGNITIWTPRGAILNSFRAHSGGVAALVVSQDGEWIASSGKRGGVMVWRRDSPAERISLGDQAAHVTALAFNPLGSLLAAGSSDGLVRVWNWRQRRQELPDLWHGGFAINSIAFSPSGEAMVISSRDEDSHRVDYLRDAEGAFMAPPLKNSAAGGSAFFDSTGTRIIAAPFLGESSHWKVSWQDWFELACNQALAAPDDMTDPDLTTARLVCDSGVTTAPVRDRHFSELQSAVESGDFSRTSLLLQPGAGKRTGGAPGSLLLIDAAAHGRYGIAWRLLVHGVDPNGTDEMGRTPLHHAAFHGDAALVRLLIAKGARATLADRDGVTPLMEAASRGNLWAARVLLDSGAPADAKDLNGNTALIRAAQRYRGGTAIVRLLLDHKAAIDKRTTMGLTALRWAKTFANDSISSALRGAGARDEKPPPPVRPRFAAAAHRPQGFAIAAKDLEAWEHPPDTGAKSVQLFRRAMALAMSGSSFAEFLVGRAFATGLGTNVDLVQAREWYTRSAAHGDGLGRAFLGMMYWLGEGVPQDIKQANKWLRLAAHSNDGSMGKVFLAWMYLGGVALEGGTEVGECASLTDDSRPCRTAHNLLKEAATEDPVAQASLAYYLRADDCVEVVKLYEASAKANDSHAENNLGNIYLFGTCGQKSSWQKAIVYYKQSFEHGDPLAAFRLGWMHEHGLGVPRSAARALDLYRKAAAMATDDPEALRELYYRLAAMAEQGLACQSSRVEAVHWYRKAAALRSGSAIIKLDALGLVP
jgi:WD40 repeat protein/TPR repeat protein